MRCLTARSSAGVGTRSDAGRFCGFLVGLLLVLARGGSIVLGALLISALSLDLGPRLEFVRRVVELVALRLVRLVLLIARAQPAATRSLVAARSLTSGTAWPPPARRA
jgi:uncharacterized membrane protein